MLFIDPAEIDWIEAGHNFVRLHVGSKAFRVRRTLAELEASLHDYRFARIHRGILVRLDKIRELRLEPGWRCGAVLTTGVTLSVSRTYRTPLLRRLGARLRGARSAARPQWTHFG
jgi:two-component system LytT family response regulator